jgi:hypothetical protein
MPLKQILEQFGNKIGLDPSVQSQRDVMLRFINEAAEELYDQTDMNGSLYEQLFKMNGDQTVAFPFYVGEIRACRPFDTKAPIHIQQMRPRYNVINWPDMWRTFRIKNKHPLHTSIRNQSVFNITVNTVEDPPIVITIAGPTEFSERHYETITMDSVTKQTQSQYNDISLFSKDRLNNYNVTLTDADDLEMAVIPNNQLQSEYLHIDVSELPFTTQNSAQAANWFEILYKKKLSKLSLDSDEFPAHNYDNIVVNKSFQLYYEEQEKPDLAIAFDAKASRSMARKIQNENAATEDVVAMVPNPHDTLLPTVRSGRMPWFSRFRY